MSEQLDPQHYSDTFSLWLGMLGAPVIWLIQLQTTYTLVTWSCRNQNMLPLRASSFVFLLLAMAGAFIAWRNWAAIRPQASKEGGDHIAVRYFLGSVGLVISSLFCLIIVAQAIPTFLIDPCEF